MDYCERFFYAMRMGKMTTVRQLLDENPELANMREQKSLTPLHVAAQSGDLDYAPPTYTSLESSRRGGANCLIILILIM